MKGPEEAIAFVGLSLAEVGKELARLTDRRYPYSKAMVSKWKSGARVDPLIVEAFGVLIASRLTALMGRRVGVRIALNSPWHVEPWAECIDCGAWFRLKRVNHKRCAQCVR